MGVFHLGNVVFLFYTCVHAVIFYFLLENVYQEEEGICEGILLLLEAGLVYDNFLLAFGGLLRSYQYFPSLSKLRFLLHGSVIPSCFLLLLHLLHRWIEIPSYVFITTYITVTALVVHGTHVSMTERYKYTDSYGIIRYTTERFVVWNLVPAILLDICSMLVGIIEYQVNGTFILLVGSIVMFISAGLPRGLGFYAGNFGEIVLCASYVLVVFNNSSNFLFF